MPNGTTTFFSDAKAAQQAVADLANTTITQSTLVRRAPEDPMAIVAIAGAAAGVASAVFGAASFGVLLANLLRGNQTQFDSLQIEVTNSTAVPLVLFNYVPHYCNISGLADPLLPGQTGLVLITSTPGSTFSNSTALQLDFLIGTSASSSIQVSTTYNLTDFGTPGRWRVSATVDGTRHEFAKVRALVGASFTGNSSFPSFSFYTSPIETRTGKIDLNFYTLASPT